MKQAGVLCCLSMALTSAITLADTPEPVSVPDVPTLLVDKDTGTGEVVLSWTSTTMPYAVVRGTDPNFFDGTAPAIIATGLTATNYLDPVLNDGTTYFYTIDDANVPPKVFDVSPSPPPFGAQVAIGGAPGGGLPGDSFDATGLGFSAVLADNKVFIGGTQAMVTSATSTLLSFEIPTNALTGRLMITTATGTTNAGLFTVLATSGLPQISSLAVDSVGMSFVATTGSGTDADRVFTFDSATGARTEVGFLGEATGLPVDNGDGIFYGNATINTANQGSIERTTSAGGKGFYRACGQPGGVDPCYVFGMGVDPDLTDFGSGGRLYVADGFNQVVKLVPPTGLIQTFASGFSFGASPRGVVPNRNSGSTSYHDVFVADSTSVRQFDSATIPGTLVKTYTAANSPVMSPRQMAISPLANERLLIADDTQDGVIMINPATDKSKVIAIPLTNPRAIAVDENVGGKPFAYVGEPTRVVKFPIHRTVFIAVWVANGAPISELEIRRQIEQANAALEICGFEVRLRDDMINFFDAGTLLDLDKSSGGCLPPVDRSVEEAALLDDTSRRSSEPTDLNVYYVKSFTTSGIARTIMEDCFAGVSDATGSGIIVSAEKILEYQSFGSVNTLAHEIGHALIDQDTWAGGNEHTDQTITPYADENIMFVPLAPRRRDFGDPDQCLNIDTDATIFRGDP